MSDIIKDINNDNLDISKSELVKLYKILIHNFQEYDCDTLYEVTEIDKLFHFAYYSLYPEKLDDRE